MTADGKGMQAMHFQTGLRCWTCGLDCNQLPNLAPQLSVGTHVRYGDFLGAIPVGRRVGDYVHAACRILNAVLKRLHDMGPGPAKSDLKKYIQNISDDLAHIPVVDRTNTKYKRQGTIDLTQSNHILTSETLLNRLVEVVQRHQGKHTVPFDGRNPSLHVVVRVLLFSLTALYKAWQHKQYLTPVMLTHYDEHLNRFTEAWRALSWKPTIWVHWVSAHSSFFMRHHLSLYLFSSIPTEKRHQNFKMDLRHCFQGWKLSRSYLHGRGLVHVVNLSALDLGLLMWHESQGLVDPKRARL